MTDLYDALKADLASRLPPGAGVRFSLREDSLFMTDAARRFPGAELPAPEWRVRGEGGIWFCTPASSLVIRLCPGEESPVFPAGPVGRFASLLYRYREEGEAEEGFVLLLLRTLGKAHLGGKAGELLPPVKAAYARALAEKKKIRTRENVMIVLAAARLLEGDP